MSSEPLKPVLLLPLGDRNIGIERFYVLQTGGLYTINLPFAFWNAEFDPRYLYEAVSVSLNLSQTRL